MAKERTSYVLNHFDPERIFQRRFFRDLKLPPVPDEEILKSTSAKSEDTLETLQRKITLSEQLAKRISKYKEHVARHVARLERYRRAIEQKGIVDKHADMDALRQKHQDALTLLMRYTNFVHSGDETTIYCSKQRTVKHMLDDVEGGILENINALYREERFFYRKIFAERLKAARRERGLTAKALAEQTGIPRPNVSDYEHMRYEPNLAVQVKFAQVLKKPVGWFLGTE